MKKNYINTQENKDIMFQYLLEKEKDYKAYIVSFVENSTNDYLEEIEIDIDDGDKEVFAFNTGFFDENTLKFWFSTYKEMMIRYLEDFTKGYELKTEKTKNGIKIKYDYANGLFCQYIINYCKDNLPEELEEHIYKWKSELDINTVWTMVDIYGNDVILYDLK